MISKAEERYIRIISRVMWLVAAWRDDVRSGVFAQCKTPDEVFAACANALVQAVDADDGSVKP